MEQLGRSVLRYDDLLGNCSVRACKQLREPYGGQGIRDGRLEGLWAILLEKGHNIKDNRGMGKNIGLRAEHMLYKQKGPAQSQ